MHKVIYTKYSNDRADDYRIMTKIIQDETGEKIVVKEALSEKAQTHIDNIVRYYMGLSEEYKGRLDINHCKIKGNKIEFEYLQGETLEEQFIRLYYQKEFNEMNILFDKFVEVVENCATDVFFKTDRFVQVFGDITIEKELKSLKITDIDMIFSNIIIINDTWNLIDYEWTYEFPIPIRFVLYRSIKSFLFAIGNHKDIDKISFYQRLSMDEAEIVQYEKMEEQFQKYVTKNYYDLNVLYNIIGKKSIPVWEAVEADNLRISLECQSNTIIEYQREIEQVVKDKEEIEQDRAKIIRDKEEIEQDRAKIIRDKEEIEQDRAKIIRDKKEIEQDRAKIIQDMQEIVQDRDRVIRECTTTVIEKDKNISELEQKLSVIQNSRIWKLRNKLAKLCGRE